MFYHLKLIDIKAVAPRVPLKSYIPPFNPSKLSWVLWMAVTNEQTKLVC